MHELTIHTHMTEVLRTYAGAPTLDAKLTLAALGLNGEAGEVADHLKKVLYQGHHLDMMHLVEELGDILWYLVLAADAAGCTLEDVMEMNVRKLRTRYPNGFDAERSIHREREGHAY